jgi:hypothetical protein
MRFFFLSLLLLCASAGWAGEWIYIGSHEVTSFNCVPAQTDSSPDIAAGGRVAVNGVPTGKFFASNWMVFGTKIKIPAISGGVVWACRDRLAKKCGKRIDLLLPIGKSVGLRKEKVYLWRD